MDCRARWLIALALGLQLFPGAALSQSYPSRPLRIIVPYAPGGGVDTVARPVADWLSRMWGHSAVIENRPGGGG